MVLQSIQRTVYVTLLKRTERKLLLTAGCINSCSGTILKMQITHARGMLEHLLLIDTIYILQREVSRRIPGLVIKSRKSRWLQGMKQSGIFLFTRAHLSRGLNI